MIQHHRSELDAAIEPLDDATLDASPAGGWSIKDHLAHLTAWERSIAAMLRGRPRHEGLGVDRTTYLGHDIDEINQEVYERNRDRPASEILADFRRSHQEIMSILEGISDEDLRKPYSHYLPEEPGEETGAPIVNWIAGDTYSHYLEHLEVIREIVDEQ